MSEPKAISFYIKDIHNILKYYLFFALSSSQTIFIRGLLFRALNVLKKALNYTSPAKITYVNYICTYIHTHIHMYIYILYILPYFYFSILCDKMQKTQQMNTRQGIHRTQCYVNNLLTSMYIGFLKVLEIKFI